MKRRSSRSSYDSGNDHDRGTSSHEIQIRLDDQKMPLVHYNNIYVLPKPNRVYLRMLYSLYNLPTTYLCYARFVYVFILICSMRLCLIKN